MQQKLIHVPTNFLQAFDKACAHINRQFLNDTADFFQTASAVLLLFPKTQPIIHEKWIECQEITKV